jgi:hypothetical protein
MRLLHFLFLIPFVTILIAASSTSSGEVQLSDIVTETLAESSNAAIRKVDGTSSDRAWPLGPSCIECGYSFGFLCSLMAAIFSLLGVLNAKQCEDSCRNANTAIENLTQLFAWSGTALNVLSVSRTIIIDKEASVVSLTASAYSILKCVFFAVAASQFPENFLEAFKIFLIVSASDVGAIIYFAGLIYFFERSSLFKQ